MVHVRPSLPHGHGEVLTRPAFEQWRAVLERNCDRTRRSAAGTDFPLNALRDRARRDALDAAAEYSRVLGVEIQTVDEAPQCVVMSGHQPQLYHPGVWAKTFLLQRLCDQTGAMGVNLVVDTDAFDDVSLVAPCLEPEVHRCRVLLVPGGKEVCYACAQVPAPEAVQEFCDSGARVARSLRAPAIGRHFDAFCSALQSALPDARNLGDVLTIARRRFESPARTTYLELPVSRLAATDSWNEFAAWLLGNAREFAEAYNEQLAAYRRSSGVRGRAQPFPDIEVREDAIELPLWVMRRNQRATAWLRMREGAWLLHAGDEPLEMSETGGWGVDPGGFSVAPKALVLTLFARMFLSDLFIHGVGGGRYDVVTDGVIRRLWGIEPPEFVVASMTMYLPVGGVLVTEEAVAEARQRLNRFEHNPDALLDEAEFDNEHERNLALALAEEKSVLVEAIAAENADKKALGTRIRDVNEQLARLLAPLGAALKDELGTLEGQRAASEVLTDRTYPFCLWSPLEVQDKVR